MAIKRFKAYVTEAASGGRPIDKTEKDVLEPRAKGEKDFKAKHSMTVTKHPVAGDHQFDGDLAEITEEELLEAEEAEEDEEEDEEEETDLEEGKMKEFHGYVEQGKDAKFIAKKMKLDLKTVEALMADMVEEVALEEGVVDQLKDIVKRKSAKKVKFGNGKSEEMDMTTAAALLNMLTKLKPANKAKAEKMLEKSPEGMFQLLDVAFGGK